MSILGWLALTLAVLCAGVLAYDIRARRTIFAQFAGHRAYTPRTFWLGIACWAACLLGATIVAFDDHERQACGGAPCEIIVSVTIPAR